MPGKTGFPKTHFPKSDRVSGQAVALRGQLLKRATGMAGDVDEAGGTGTVLDRTLVVNAFAEPRVVKHACLILQRRFEGKT
jgi:hypothetical protein